MLVRPLPLRVLATSVAVAVAVLGTPAGLAAGVERATRPAAAVVEPSVPTEILSGEVGLDTAGKRRTRAPQRRTKRAVALTAPARPAATSYAFSTVLDGKAVRWDPCARIRWTSNTSRGPADGLAVLQESVDRIAELTGTTWQYVGPSAETPRSDYLPGSAQQQYAPVLIGWTDGASSDLLAGQPRNVLGMTRTAWFGIKRPDGSKVAAIRAAAVALDRTDSLPLRGRGSWKALVLHELGHVMGLAHVEDRNQLMAAVLPASADLQAGDVAGLTRVGRDAGCVVIR